LWRLINHPPRLSVFHRHTRCFAEAPQLLSCGCALFRVQPVRPADVADLARNRFQSATLMEFVSPTTLQPGRVHSTSVCHTEYVPPTGFLTLSTDFSSPERPAIFQTGNVLGVRLFRDFPPLPGPATRRREVALLTFAPRYVVTVIITTTEASEATRSMLHRTFDRLQGLAPAADPYHRRSVTSQSMTDSLLSFALPSRVLPRPRLHPAQRVRSYASSPIPSPFLGTSPRADEYLEDCAPANLPGHAVSRFLNRNNPL
jgi:hypothetical protein